MSDRGMKKWAPYKALIEQDPAIVAMSKKRDKKDKPKISSDQAEEINEILVNYHGEKLLISVYKNGYVIQEEIIIAKIDPVEKKLITSERKTIYLKDVVGLKRT